MVNVLLAQVLGMGATFVSPDEGDGNVEDESLGKPSDQPIRAMRITHTDPSRPHQLNYFRLHSLDLQSSQNTVFS